MRANRCSWRRNRNVRRGTTAAILIAVAVTPLRAEDDKHGSSESRFSDEPIPLKLDEVPDRPKPLFELGPGFLDTGPLHPGIELATGAVWQPQFLVFGTYRTALQTFDNGQTKFSEWANRLDVFFELRLSGTERLLLGLRPLDEDGLFTSFNFQPKDENDWQTAFNGEITTLFFEGEIAEIFPFFDTEDFTPLDIGFSVGRQPFLIQEGIMINDTMDAVGLVRNTLLPQGTSNLRFTAIYAWNEIHRGTNLGTPNSKDDSAQLWALFTEMDTPLSTINIDFAYVSARDTGDAFYAGASAVQRIGQVNTSFSANASFPTTGENPQNTRGVLLFTEISWTPHHTDDNVYINGFYGIDEYSSAAREPATGGPLGRTGILYSAVGIGRYGSALSNQGADAYGVSLGYQKFWGPRRQLIVEIGGRKDTDDTNTGAAAIGARYQQAIGQHTIMQVDTFAAAHEDRNASYGARIEFLFKF